MSPQFSVEIEATPERVFAYLTEPELVKSWQIDLAEPPPLPPGGLRMGVRQRAVVEEYGRRFEVETEIVAFSANELLGYAMQSPNAVVRSEYRLIRQPGSTRVEANVIFEPRRLLRVLWPLFRGFFRRKTQNRLELLKKAVEAGAGRDSAALPR